MRVVVVDAIAPGGIAHLREHGCEIEPLTKPSPEALHAALANIASMHVGRKSKRGRAIVVLIRDEDLTADQVTEVARAVEADFARLIRLPQP